MMETAAPLVLVHYMIWFDYANVSGHWDWYQTPPFVPSDGCNNTENLATYFPPAVGSFASYDTSHIQYDFQQFSTYGIDGVIIDYQHPEPGDPTLPLFNKSLPLVVSAAESAGLTWGIMYDTSSMTNWGAGSPTVQSDWAYLSTVSSQSPNYLRDSNGMKLMFAFGATPLPDNRDSQAYYYVQDGRTDTGGGDGAFAWNEPDASGGDWNEYLQDFYASKCGTMYPSTPIPCIGAAFAGYQAVYPGTVLPRSPKTLQSTLSLCQQYTPICQTVTWNDYNEGTHIEPSWWCDGTNNPNEFVEVVASFKGQ